MDARELQRLRDDVAKAEKAVDRLQGAHDLVMKQLMAEYGCETLEQARKLLKKLEREAEQAEREAEEASGRFYERYGKLLEAHERGRRDDGPEAGGGGGQAGPAPLRPQRG